MTKDKNKKFIISKSRIIIFSFILLILLSTIFFAEYIEKYINYKTTIDLNNSSLKVHFIDVGQGDCSIIELPDGKLFIIDAGTYESKENICNYLNTFVLNGKKKIDYFLITHPHDDHIGGASYILENYEVHTILRPKVYSKSEAETKEFGDLPIHDIDAYEDLVNKINIETYNGENSNVYFNSSFFKIEESNYQIEFLTPNEDQYDNINNYSPMMLLTVNNKKFLFTGDAEEEIEIELLNSFYNHYEYIDVDVLKVAHHGSNTSSTSDFLNTVKTEFAVISVGENNSYNNPSDVVLERLTNSGILSNNILRTDKLGNIIILINNKNEIIVETIARQIYPFFIKYHYILIIAIILDLCIFIMPTKNSKLENI